MERIHSEVLKDNVTAVALSPDGSLIAFGLTGGSVLCCPIDSLGTGHALDIDGSVQHVAFSHDGAILAATSTKGFVRFWRHGQGRTTWWKFADKADFADLSAIGGDAFVATFNDAHGCLCSTTIQLNRETMIAIKASVMPYSGGADNCFALSRDGSRWAYAYFGTRLAVGSTSTSGATNDYRLAGKCCALVWSPDGSRVACAGEGFLTIKAYEGASALSITEDRVEPTALAFSANGKILARGTPKSLEFWNAETGVRLRFGDEHLRDISHVKFSSDGRTMVVVSGKSLVTIWRLAAEFHVEPAAAASAPLAESAVVSGVGERIKELSRQIAALKAELAAIDGVLTHESV